MAKWKYKIEEPMIELRRLLAEDDSITIEHVEACFKQLSVCLQCWKSQLRGFDHDLWDDEIDEMLTDIQETDLSLFDTVEDAMNEFNFVMNDFYDLCDNAHVWLAV